jgi:hypothetical protein
MVRERGGKALLPSPSLPYWWGRGNSQHAVQITDAAELKYIKLPMYLFIWRLDLILMGANPLVGPIEGVGPKTLDFLRPR